MTIYVKPKKGLIVPDPDRRDELPPEGREVQDSVYWRRRLNDGDVVFVEKKKEA